MGQHYSTCTSNYMYLQYHQKIRKHQAASTDETQIEEIFKLVYNSVMVIFTKSTEYGSTNENWQQT